MLAVLLKTTGTLVVGTTTVALAICPGVVAELVTVVPAVETVGVTNRCNIAPAPFSSVPTVHNPVPLL